MVATIHVSLRIKPIISYESGKYHKRNYLSPTSAKNIKIQFIYSMSGDGSHIYLCCIKALFTFETLLIYLR